MLEHTVGGRARRPRSQQITWVRTAVPANNLSLPWPPANRLHLFTIQKIPERRPQSRGELSSEHPAGGWWAAVRSAVRQHVHSCI